VSVPKAVYLHAGSESCGGSCWEPDVVAEPPTRNMPVSVNSTNAAGAVFAVGAALGPVDGVSSCAVIATALPCRISAERSVPVGTAQSVVLRPAQGLGIRHRTQSRLTDLDRHAEQKVVVAEIMRSDVRLDLVDQLAAQRNLAMFPVFRVFLDNEPSPIGMKLLDQFDRNPADRHDPGCP